MLNFKRKYPFDRLILFMLLARNSYKTISVFLKENNMGSIDGKVLASYEAFIKSNATAKEKGILEGKGASPKRKPKKKAKPKPETDEIEILAKIPSKLKALAKRVKIEDSPFDNENIMTITCSQIIKRAIEVYMTSKMDMVEILKLINNKFRMNFVLPDIIAYRYWVYDTSGVLPDDLMAYFNTLDRNEQDYKKMAYLNKNDYVRWKMQDDFEVDMEAATSNLMASAYFNLQEILKNRDRISHNAVKVWSELFFKSTDHMQKIKDAAGASLDIFKEVRFILRKRDDSDEVIPFEELYTEDEEEDGDANELQDGTEKI